MSYEWRGKSNNLAPLGRLLWLAMPPFQQAFFLTPCKVGQA
jgi:hypothetical protein